MFIMQAMRYTVFMLTGVYKGFVYLLTEKQLCTINIHVCALIYAVIITFNIMICVYAFIYNRTAKWLMQSILRWFSHYNL